MEMQPLKVRVPPADISDTQKSMAEVSNIETSSNRCRDDVSTLRVRHRIDFSSAVLVTRNKAEKAG